MFGYTPIDPYSKSIICRRGCAGQLRDRSSEELRELVLGLLKKHKGEKMGSLDIQVANPQNDLFVYGGACDVLRDRHGEEYVMDLAGIRKPKTIGEWAKYIFRGEYPRVERKAA